MAQNAVQIGQGGFGPFQPHSTAYPLEKFLTGLLVEFDAEETGAGFQQRGIIVKNIGAVETDIEQPAEPPDSAADVTGQGGQQLHAKTVMGIC